jgi:two-component system response regulator HydG
MACSLRRVFLQTRWGGTDVRVLIEGETGVGKELVARTLHALGRRREHRFVAVDCGALSETLADSELFGHVKGSFTGALRDRVGLIEEADGGTLLLDEVGELSEMLQTKLLRVLEERKVRRVGENTYRPIDIRVMSATTRDLGQAVEEGHFRRDLYYRLKGVLIRVPALRERRGDIDLLLDHFLRTQSERYGKTIRLSRKARMMLREYDWPGNVRELKNTVEALVVSSEDKTVVTADLLDRLMLSPHRESGHPRRLKEIEQEEIERVLSVCGGNKSKAAKMLGITRKTLYSRLSRE